MKLKSRSSSNSRPPLHSKSTISVTSIDTMVLLVVAILMLSLFVSTGYISPKLKQGSFYSISYMEQGSISNDKVIGGKIHVNAVISKGTDSLQILTKGEKIKMGDKIVEPQKSLTISLKNLGSYALADHTTSSFSYYKPKWGSVLTSQFVTNTGPWSVHNPLSIKTYIGNSNTLFSSKNVELFGQSQVSLDDNSRIVIKQIDTSFLGPDIPNENVAAMTSINIPRIPDPSYQPNKINIFDKFDLITKSQTFYNQYGTYTFDYLTHPDYVLWSGYDKGAILGWKKKDWRGLPHEVNKPSSKISYNPTTGKFTLKNIDFTSNVDIIIDSELVDTILIRKGIGIVSDVKFNPPTSLSKNNPEIMTVTFKNTGELDTFNIIPNSEHGEVVFTPKSYIDSEVKPGETKSFDFIATPSGNTGLNKKSLESHDTITLNIQPSNGDKTTSLTKDITIQQTPLPSSLSAFGAGNFSFNPNIPNSGIHNLKATSWYSNIYAIAGILLLLLTSTIYIFTSTPKTQKSPKNHRRNSSSLSTTSITNTSIKSLYTNYSLILYIILGAIALITIVYYVSIHPTATTIMLALIIIAVILHFVLRLYLQFKDGFIDIIGGTISSALNKTQPSQSKRRKQE